jgi:hypothetical protein
MTIYKKGKLYSWISDNLSGKQIFINSEPNELQVAKSFIELLDEKLSFRPYFDVIYILDKNEEVFRLNKEFLLALKQSYLLSYKILKSDT